MRFSEYLRLDEGNYGHDVEKGRLPKGKKKAKKPNTVDDYGEVMLDPKTGKPFPAKGPLKDWQIPSLREDNRQYDPNVTRENEKDESKSSTPPVITNPKHPKYNPNHPTNVRRRNNKIENRMKEREAREKRLKDTIEHSEAKRKANESVEVPTRDALGRLSIHSINEASKAKLKRKLKSGNTTYAEKQASMKQLKLKQADQKKRATKRAATEPDLSIAVRAGDAASEGSVVLPGGDKPLKRSKLRPGSADLQKHEDEQADSRSSDEGTPRQRHLDK